MGSFREFAIEPTLEAICVPKPHPSGGVALSLIATHRPQSLFGEVTKRYDGEELSGRSSVITSSNDRVESISIHISPAAM